MKRKTIKTALAVISTFGVGIMARSLVPASAGVISKVICDITIGVLTLSTYEVMTNKADEAIKEAEDLINGNVDFKVI